MFFTAMKKKKRKIKEAPQGFFYIFVESDCKYIYFEELQMHKLE